MVTPWRDRGRSGARGADFARGRGARSAGQRPPAPLPTLRVASIRVSYQSRPSESSIRVASPSRPSRALAPAEVGYLLVTARIISSMIR